MQKLNDEQKAEKIIVKFCPKKHELLKTRTVSLERAASLVNQYKFETAYIFCDICHTPVFYLKEKSAKEEFYTCDICHFDVCQSCFDSFR